MAKTTKNSVIEVTLPDLNADASAPPRGTLFITGSTVEEVKAALKGRKLAEGGGDFVYVYERSLITLDEFKRLYPIQASWQESLSPSTAQSTPTPAKSMKARRSSRR